MTAYYNEIDPYAAQWLRNLIAAGHIAPGDVDERSIEDVRPDELAGYEQCHFFAGVGVWSLALRRAGWADSRPVWTGSCPCQPFSSAGKGGGFDDERHLWPAWQWLIQQRRPTKVFGEQVASKAVEPWIDLIQADLEAMGYAVGCVPFPSAGVGAPHIRDRAFWLAYAPGEGSQGVGSGRDSRSWREGPTTERSGQDDRLADADRPGAEGHGRDRGQSAPEGRLRGGSTYCGGDGRLANPGSERRDAGRNRDHAGDDWAKPDANGEDGRMAYTNINGCDQGREGEPEAGDDGPERDDVADTRLPGPINGFWRAADWLYCRDGKWRPVRPGTFPLADGAPVRVGRLRAYGNAINVEAAKEFIIAAGGV